jgi:hypothetical protein
MRRVWAMAAVALTASAAYGQAQFVNNDGSRTQGTVIECLVGGLVTPCGTTSSPLETDQGTPGTGTNLPVGASGVLGFLSAIYAQLLTLYAKLSSTIAISGPVTAMPASGPLIDNSTASLGGSSTVLLLACGGGTSQQTGCANGSGRSRLILLNEGMSNACANYSGPAFFVAGSSSNCAAGSFLLPADGGGIDDSTGVVSNQQVNAVCASGTCVLTVKSY